MSEIKRTFILSDFTISGGEHCTANSSDNFAYRFYSYDTGYTSWFLVTWGELQNEKRIVVPDDTITKAEVAKVTDVNVVSGQTIITVDNNTIIVFTIDTCGGIITRECGDNNTYSGTMSMPATYEINLGTDKGVVLLEYNAMNVPDKFVVTFDGVEVINTGYVGDTSYQSDLDEVLTPNETISGQGQGSISFCKNTITTTATVEVYAPLETTKWDFTLTCPEPYIGITLEYFPSFNDVCNHTNGEVDYYYMDVNDFETAKKLYTDICGENYAIEGYYVNVQNDDEIAWVNNDGDLQGQFYSRTNCP